MAPKQVVPAAPCVGLLAALFLLPRLWEPLGRDQAVFALVGRLAWQGKLPYRDVFEHKPPGLLMLYALVAPLGQWGPALLDTAAAALTAGLLVVLLRPVGRRPAVLAGLLYAVLARHPVFGGFWDVAQPEPLQEAALAAAALGLVRQRWFMAGAAVCMALLLKFTLVLAVPVAVLAVWPERRALAQLAAGLLTPLLAVVVVMGALGGLGPMLDIVLAFNLRHAGNGALALAQLPQAVAGNGRHFAPAFGGLWLIAAWGLWTGAGQRQPLRKPALLLFATLLAAAGQALIQAKLWVWHWQAVVLPMAALAGLGLAALRPRWQIATASAALLMALPGWLQYHDRHPWTDLVAGQMSRTSWLQGYTWGRRDWSGIEVAAVGAWLQQHAASQDRLLVWGFEPGIYLASGLMPATRWIYDYPVTVALDPRQRQLAVAEIAASLPDTRWWVVMGADRNALESQPSDQQLRGIAVLDAALQRDYRLVERVGDAAIYRRAPP